MPVDDKLALINRCLLLKGQRVVAAEDDGSLEWNVCSAAYDTYFEPMLEDAEFKFSTQIQELTRTGDATDEHFDDAYGLPNGCLHLITVKIDDVKQPYRIVGNEIQISCETTDEVMAKFVAEPDVTELSALFKVALQEAVYSGIESGLKKDQAIANGHIAKADAALQRAKTRGDQQEGKKALFVTRHRTARQFRRG
jgi:hypothetical protein